jgi:hypothetical protein
MATKQAAAGEALAAQINAMSRSEVYDMMSQMKVRARHPQSPNPTCTCPLSVRFMAGFLIVLLVL